MCTFPNPFSTSPPKISRTKLVLEILQTSSRSSISPLKWMSWNRTSSKLVWKQQPHSFYPMPPLVEKCETLWRASTFKFWSLSAGANYKLINSRSQFRREVNLFNGLEKMSVISTLECWEFLSSDVFTVARIGSRWCNGVNKMRRNGRRFGWDWKKLEMIQRRYSRIKSMMMHDWRKIVLKELFGKIERPSTGGY